MNTPIKPLLSFERLEELFRSYKPEARTAEVQAAIDAALENFFHFGRMVSDSKSGYDQLYPNNVVVFNGNICTKTYGKIWYGDLDVTKDEAKLMELAKALGEDLYILREMDARFENEKAPRFDRARAIVSPTKVVYTDKVIK